MSIATATILPTWQFPTERQMSSYIGGKRKHEDLDVEDAITSYTHGLDRSVRKRFRTDASPSTFQRNTTVYHAALVATPAENFGGRRVKRDRGVAGLETPVEMQQTSRTLKRNREEEDDAEEDDIVELDLHPSAKKIRADELEYPLSTAPDSPIPMEEDVFTDVPQPESLALVRYRPQREGGNLDGPRSLKVDDLLNDKLCARCTWDTFPKYSLSEGDGQIVLYTGGKWQPPAEAGPETLNYDVEGRIVELGDNDMDMGSIGEMAAGMTDNDETMMEIEEMEEAEDPTMMELDDV